MDFVVEDDSHTHPPVRASHLLASDVPPVQPLPSLTLDYTSRRITRRTQSLGRV